MKKLLLFLYLPITCILHGQYSDSAAYSIPYWTDSVFYRENYSGKLFILTDYSISKNPLFRIDSDEYGDYREFRIPATLNNNKIQKFDCGRLPYGIGKLYVPSTIKYLKCQPPRQSKDLKLPSSLWYVKIDVPLEDSILLPVKTKKDHEFLGWYNSNDEWYSDILYVKYIEGTPYKAIFKYLKDDFYTLMEEDCIFSNNKIHENFYSGACKIIIPNEVDGKYIKTIGEETFSYKQFSEIILPEFLLYINEGAFSGNELQEIKLPAKLKTISKNAFAGNKINHISFPNELDSIGIHAFAGNSIDSLILPNNVQYIGKGAFLKNKLSYILYNNKVTYIGPEAFALNEFTEGNIPRLPEPQIENKTFLYWQSFKRGKYNHDTKSYPEIPVSHCQPGEKMDLELGYRAVFEGD